MKKDLRTSRGMGEKVYTLLANSDLQEADFITAEIARLKATQVRRLIVFGILGVLMLILGFFAGRQLRQQSGSQGVPGSSRIAAPTASCGVVSSPTQARAADPGAASEAAVGGADAGMRGAA